MTMLGRRRRLVATDVCFSEVKDNVHMADFFSKLLIATVQSIILTVL